MRNVALPQMQFLKKRVAARCILAASLFLCLPAANHAATPQVPPQLWYGIYLLNQPVGGSYMATSTAPYEGKASTLSVSQTKTSFNLAGTKVSQEVDSKDWSDPTTGKPLYEEVVITSGGHNTTVTAHFTDTAVTAELDSGGSKETRVLNVPSDAILLADDPTMAPPETSKGKKVMYFDPATIALEEVTTAPASGPQPTNGDKRIVVTTPTGSVTVEQAPDGAPERVDMPGGLYMQRETADKVAAYMDTDHAPTINVPGTANSEEAPPDLAIVTSVEPVGMPLLAHPSLTELVVTQPGHAPAHFSIRAIDPNPVPTDTLAMVANRKDLAPYLANSVYLGLDNDAIRSQAQEIVGGKIILYDIAVQLQKWVHDSMMPTATMGLPRSATDILGDKRGVCRDYALLYTALARSAGLPTRLCAGLVGFRGRFYYHAWAESYVGGKIGWMPFDPTLLRQPVDASHIPLVKGDPASLYDLVGKIGNLKVNIIRCEP